ncbi:MAG: hypothetical protein ACOC5R_02795, partial [Elusimicrobiota bacterium]
LFLKNHSGFYQLNGRRTIIFCFLLLLGIFLLKKNSLNFIFLIIICHFFLIFTINKIQPNLTGLAGTFISILVVVLFIYLLLVKKRIDRQRRKILFIYLFFIIITIFYLLINALLKDIDPLIYLHYFRNHFWFIVILFYFIFLKSVVDKKKFINLMFILLFVQASIGLLQYFGPRDVSRFFLMDAYERSSGEIRTIVDERNVRLGSVETGTLGRINNFGNTLSVMIIYLSFILFYNKEKKRHKSHFIKKVNFFQKFTLAIGILAVFLCGVKTSVLSLLIGLIVLLWYKSKKLAISLLIVLAFFISIYQSFIIDYSKEIQKMLISNREETGFMNPLSRLATVFVLLDNISDFDKKQLLTLKRTFSLYPFVCSNPLFGAGYYWTKGYGTYTGYLHFKSKEFSRTDATLMFYIVEFGILGFFIVLIPYIFTIYLVKKYGSKKSYITIKTVFIVLLLQTITDLGLFLLVSNMLFFVIAGIEMNLSRKKFALRRIKGK